MSDVPQPTGLAHIKDGQVDAAVFSQHCVDWSVWALKVKACIDTSAPSASLEVYLAGAKIGHCRLDSQHQDCKIGGSVAGFKAEVSLSIAGNCLKADAEVCAPLAGCKTWSHELFCW